MTAELRPQKPLRTLTQMSRDGLTAKRAALRLDNRTLETQEAASELLREEGGSGRERRFELRRELGFRTKKGGTEGMCLGHAGFCRGAGEGVWESIWSQERRA